MTQGLAISKDPVTPPVLGKSRRMLLRRLIDVVALPATRIAPQDRSMAGDILLDMLIETDNKDRALCARRLKEAVEAPRRLLRFLGQCHIDVARELLEENKALDSADLCHIIDHTGVEHCSIIARRAHLSASVAERLAEKGEVEAVISLLRNQRAEIPETAMDIIVARSRTEPQLCELAARRQELRPSQAMAMFWWSDGLTRRQILQRQAADRRELIDLCSDVFAVAAEENWQDPVSRKTLQLIERRQRNRAAIEKSPYASLEDAVTTASLQGITAELAQEIGYLAGVKPVTIAKILTDKSGEGLAVVCKATGLKRPYLAEFWKALRRPLETEDGAVHPDFKRISDTYELLSVPKAQTTLRYWNWALSSAYSPRMFSKLNNNIDEDPDANSDSRFSASQRTARLVFGN